MIQEKLRRNALFLILPLLAALLSFFVLAGVASSSEFHKHSIAALEEKIEMLDQEMAAASTDFVKLNQLVTEKEETEKLLEEKMDRWVYLNDLAEQIENQ